MGRRRAPPGLRRARVPRLRAPVAAARRLAGSLHAGLVAAYVEPPGSGRRAAADRQRDDRALAPAQSLGAETVRSAGTIFRAEESRAIARSRTSRGSSSDAARASSVRRHLVPSFLDRSFAQRRHRRLRRDRRRPSKRGPSTPASRERLGGPVQRRPIGLLAGVAWSRWRPDGEL